VTPSIAVQLSSNVNEAGVPYSLTLDAGETYELKSSDPTGDLSGSFVEADKPIAVFSGHECANVPDGNTGACDYLVEQMPPIQTWGRQFVTVPLATRLGGDTFHFLAAEENTVLSINGEEVATLRSGEVRDQLIIGPAQVTANHPILVAQYSNGSSFDGVISDPFMMLIPPFEQFATSYTVTTPATGFRANFINVVAPTSSVGSIVFDGAAIAVSEFVPIGISGFSGAQLSVALGSHTLKGARPFGAFVYGFDEYDSYGYPGGLDLAPVANVIELRFLEAPHEAPVGEQACFTLGVMDGEGHCRCRCSR
jgi:hypothetical protein